MAARFKNAEGYDDPTPGGAMSNIALEQQKRGRRTPCCNQQSYPDYEADR